MMTAAYLPYIMRDPSTQTYRRGVAQPGSAPPWGGGGRRFKSSRPDHSSSPYMPSLARLVFSILPPIEAVIPEERSVGFFNIPVAAAEHRSRNRECRETFDRARGALYSARRVRRAPVPARSAGRFRWLRGAFSFGDFRPAPSLARALRARGARPILLPAKLSLREQRQIRWDRIWTAEGCLQGEDQGWSESKVTCRGSATHKYASPQATQNRVQGRSHPQLAFHNARTARDTITR